MQDHGVQYKRITVDVPPEFHQQVKRMALDLETTVSDIVRELLTESLAAHQQKHQAPEQTE